MAGKTDITMDEARALVADAALWPRVRDFLWDFASQIHPSWIDGLGLPGPLGGPDMLRNPRVKRHILSSLGVEPCFHVFPRDDWSRLLILDGAALESIAKWLGALALSDELRRVTDGRAVRELKAGLSGVYPEVFGYTMYFTGIGLRRGGADPEGSARGRESHGLGPRDVASAGVSILASLLGHLPSPLASRLRLKLPKDLCAPESPLPRQETCGRALAKLLKLRFPEAYSLCC